MAEWRQKGYHLFNEEDVYMIMVTKRVLIPLTNEHFAAWCLKMLG